MRKIKMRQAEMVVARVKALADLREKFGYKKLSDKRRRRIRGQIRYQLECLKTDLPKIEGVYSPCNPNGWEVIDTTEIDKAKAEKFFAMMAAMGMPWSGH